MVENETPIPETGRQASLQVHNAWRAERFFAASAAASIGLAGEGMLTIICDQMFTDMARNVISGVEITHTGGWIGMGLYVMSLLAGSTALAAALYLHGKESRQTR
ncbi:MAG TPA: hypothetical protein VMW41_02190 [Candidatus Bathyarchaeia archaeon]|nr:hypothetical protein [Candidatus Bathyarchaeia archaeon]